MLNNRDRRNGLILSSNNTTYGKYNNRRKAQYNLNDVVLGLDSNDTFNISSGYVKLSDDEFEVEGSLEIDSEGEDSFRGISDVPYASSHLVNIAVSDNENDISDMMIASPQKGNKKSEIISDDLQEGRDDGNAPKNRPVLQDVSPMIQNSSNVLTNDINGKRVPLNSANAPTFQRNSSVGLSHLRNRSSIVSNSSKRWSLMSFNNDTEKENSISSNKSKRFSINSIPSIHSVQTSSPSNKNKRFSISSQHSSSNSSVNSFKTAMNKVGNILSSVSVNSDNSNESTPYKNLRPGVVGASPSTSQKRSSDSANLTPVALRQPQPTTKNQKILVSPVMVNVTASYKPKVDDDTISLMSATTTSSLRTSRSRFRLSSIFSSSQKKENADGESIRSLKGKSSFNDIRRSVLRLNKKDSLSDLNRNMISLPKPDHDSRLKLSNRLRNSASVISINSTLSRQQTITTMNTTVNTTTSTINSINSAQLEKLTRLTGRDHIYSFNSYINDVLKLSENEILIKFNEASYSEVYQVKNLQTKKIEKILKIIPFGNDSVDQPSTENVIQELTINFKVQEFPGFIKINDSIIVEGVYPNLLLKLWDDFNELKGSKNLRPNEFNASQKYLILDLEYGGLDLERFPIYKWNEPLEIFWQIVKYLSVVEKKLNFEHRDLHWGNIVIQRIKESEDTIQEIDADLSNISIDQSKTSVAQSFSRSRFSVKLIDYSLSRLNEGNEVICTRLDHPDFFKGKGDYQFDIYRFMRNEIQQKCEQQETNWSLYTPRNNLYWLHYILMKLIHDKSLKKKHRDISYKKLEYLCKCLDPRRKNVSMDKNSKMTYKNGNSQWMNYYSDNFDDCSDLLNFGEVCKLF